MLPPAPLPPTPREAHSVPAAPALWALEPQAEGHYCAALGAAVVAKGHHSAALGAAVVAEGHHCAALGAAVVADTATTAVGHYWAVLSVVDALGAAGRWVIHT